MTVEVESAMSPDGEFAVTLWIDQDRKWFKPKPVYLTSGEARKLAGRIMEATGYRPGVVLEEEAIELRKALDDPDLDPARARELQTFLGFVDLMRKVLHRAGAING